MAFLFIASKCVFHTGFAGKDDWEQTLNDLVVEVCHERFPLVGKRIYRWKLFKVDPEPENPEEVIAEVRAGLLEGITYIQKIAEERSRKFIVGDEVSQPHYLLITFIRARI